MNSLGYTNEQGDHGRAGGLSVYAGAETEMKIQLVLVLDLSCSSTGCIQVYIEIKLISGKN